MTLIGLRTLVAFLASLAVMLTGFWLLPADARGAAFVFFSGGIGALMTVLAGKASVDALAQGGGTQGVKAAFTTSAKPGDPPPPSAP